MTVSRLFLIILWLRFVYHSYTPILSPASERIGGILISEPATSFPLARSPKGKEGTNTTWVVLEWKVQAYHFTKYHHQHSDKPINKGYKQRRAKFRKVSTSHYKSGYFQIKNAQPSGYAWIYQNDIIKKCVTKSATQKLILIFSIIARSSIITTAGAFVKQLIYQIVIRTRSFVRIKFALYNYHSAHASFSIKRGTFYE